MSRTFPWWPMWTLKVKQKSIEFLCLQEPPEVNDSMVGKRTCVDCASIAPSFAQKVSKEALGKPCVLEFVGSWNVTLIPNSSGMVLGNLCCLQFDHCNMHVARLHKISEKKHRYWFGWDPLNSHALTSGDEKVSFTSPDNSYTYNGYPWCSMDVHGSSADVLAYLWVSMDICACANNRTTHCLADPFGGWCEVNP